MTRKYGPRFYIVLETPKGRRGMTRTRSKHVKRAFLLRLNAVLTSLISNRRHEAYRTKNSLVLAQKHCTPGDIFSIRAHHLESRLADLINRQTFMELVSRGVYGGVSAISKARANTTVYLFHFSFAKSLCVA